MFSYPVASGESCNRQILNSELYHGERACLKMHILTVTILTSKTKKVDIATTDDVFCCINKMHCKIQIYLF